MFVIRLWHRKSDASKLTMTEMNRGSNLEAGPRQNRVTPAGKFEAVTARGAFLGNRGRLHDCTGALGVATYQHRAWVTCELEWRGRHRTINSPGSYTELFFADEAVALSAGHRPCAECRRGAFNRFRDAWQRALGLPRPPRAVEMDAELHRSRLDHNRQRTFTAQLGQLPAGTMIEAPGSVGLPALLWGGQLHPWRHTGYAAPIAADMGSQVVVLTPRPTVAALLAGYSPAVELGRPTAAISHRGRVSGLADPHPCP